MSIHAQFRARLSTIKFGVRVFQSTLAVGMTVGIQWALDAPPTAVTALFLLALSVAFYAFTAYKLWSLWTDIDQHPDWREVYAEWATARKSLGDLLD